MNICVRQKKRKINKYRTVEKRKNQNKVALFYIHIVYDLIKSSLSIYEFNGGHIFMNKDLVRDRTRAMARTRKERCVTISTAATATISSYRRKKKRERERVISRRGVTASIWMHVLISLSFFLLFSLYFPCFFFPTSSILFLHSFL